MNDKLKELYEKVSGDESLKESIIKGLEAISSDDEKKDYIINFAKEQGVTISKEDFAKLDSMKPVSDNDLESIAGGACGDKASAECGSLSYASCMAFLAMAGFFDCQSYEL